MKMTTFEEFERLTHAGTFVPVYKEIMADLLTPVSAFLKIAEHSDYAFLLESVEGGEHVARYSFLGKDPFLVLRSRGAQTILECSGVTSESSEPMLSTLKGIMADLRAPAVPDLPRFTGGAVGHLGFGTAGWFDPDLGGGARHPDPGPLDDLASFMLFDSVLAFDHVKHRILIIANARVGAADDLKALYEFACAKVQFLERELDRTLSRTVASTPEVRPTRDNMDRDAYEQAVTRAQSMIQDGALQQVVLSRRVDTRIAVDPFSVYRALRHEHPSPYMYFIRMGSNAIVGASPEMLVRMEGKHVEMHPVAGTRPRGSDGEQDAALVESLRSSERVRTEHAALVDQGRADMARVCEYGTVRVPHYMEVDRYSHVLQMVSTVEGKLDDAYDRFDALAACFPAGTVSGVPKREAMRAIDEIEPDGRGLYAGAIGYLDFAGNQDFCTAIRTIAVRDGRASLQEGVPIGRDTDPGEAFRETVAKAEALLRALAHAHGEL